MLDKTNIAHAVREQLLRHGRLEESWGQAYLVQRTEPGVLMVHIEEAAKIEADVFEAILAELIASSRANHFTVLVHNVTSAYYASLRAAEFTPVVFSRKIWGRQHTSR